MNSLQEQTHVCGKIEELGVKVTSLTSLLVAQKISTLSITLKTSLLT